MLQINLQTQVQNFRWKTEIKKSESALNDCQRRLRLKSSECEGEKQKITPPLFPICADMWCLHFLNWELETFHRQPTETANECRKDPFYTLPQNKLVKCSD